MKLELKHLSPYLPFKLELHYPNNEVNSQDAFLDEHNIGEYLFYPLGLPILRPLSDLTKPMVNYLGENVVPAYSLFRNYKEGKTGLEYDLTQDGIIEIWISDYKTGIIYETLVLGDYMKLFKWHFDVFGLIEKGLAIDINTL